MNELLLKKIQEYFRDKPVSKAYIFGSFGTRYFTKDSDIDIMVELDHSQAIGLQFVRMKLDLEDLLHYKIDLLTSNSVSKYISPQIDQEKQLIYER